MSNPYELQIGGHVASFGHFALQSENAYLWINGTNPLTGESVLAMCREQAAEDTMGPWEISESDIEAVLPGNFAETILQGYDKLPATVRDIKNDRDLRIVTTDTNARGMQCDGEFQKYAMIELYDGDQCVAEISGEAAEELTGMNTPDFVRELMALMQAQEEPETIH